LNPDCRESLYLTVLTVLIISWFTPINCCWECIY